MMPRFPLTLLVVVTLTGCAHSASRLSTSNTEAQPAGAQVQLLAALAWPRLEARPTATSEIRLWIDHGLIVPHHVLRITHKGSRFAAAIARWWPNDSELLNSVEPRSGRTFGEIQMGDCPKLHKTKEISACVVALPDAVAKRIYSELLTLGVWDLHERRTPEDGMIVVTADGEGMSVDLRRAADYRRMIFTTSSKEDSQYDAQAALVASFANHLVASYDPP